MEHEKFCLQRWGQKLAIICPGRHVYPNTSLYTFQTVKYWKTCLGTARKDNTTSVTLLLIISWGNDISLCSTGHMIFSTDAYSWWLQSNRVARTALSSLGFYILRDGVPLKKLPLMRGQPKISCIKTRRKIGQTLKVRSCMLCWSLTLLQSLTWKKEKCDIDRCEWLMPDDTSIQTDHSWNSVLRDLPIFAVSTQSAYNKV